MGIGEILGYLLVGVVVGPLARFLVPGKDPMSILMTVLLGAVGAFLGGWLFAQYITPDNTGVPWIAAVLGGVVLVLLYRLVSRSRTAT
ncbi:MAG: GlsB/YeaQ/YmgE family stress response membrane protein [Acidimicrobiia bacterium]